MIRRAMERGGHTVVEAAGGLEGARLFKESDIDLVITDLLMPDQRGVFVIDRIRELDGNVPIIAISGDDDPRGPLNDAMLLGASMRLGKPFSVEELLAAVALLLAGDENPA